MLLAMVVCRTACADQAFGNFERPFAKDSPWNQKPVGVTLGTAVVTATTASPMVADKAYSTAVFATAAGDGGVTVAGVSGHAGPWNPDSGTAEPITLPHWPVRVAAPEGTDGHADIVDTTTRIIHSFWQLRQEDGKWRASQYAWSCLGGRGWGDPAHYFQGARAAGVPAMAGVIRRHEAHDGTSQYQHALALSLPAESLSAEPPYVFPATSADTDAAASNSGQIAEGTLLMLPPAFDIDALATPALRKIARTLQTYGGYVVDRNVGTAFVIYAENGAALGLHAGGWRRDQAAELEQLRAALRPLVAASGWRDGAGQIPPKAEVLSLLSLRGPWEVIEGQGAGRFDSWTQAVNFAAGQGPTRLKRAWQPSPVRWGQIMPGARLRLFVKTSGEASFRMVLRDRNGSTRLDTGEIRSGTAAGRPIRWPSVPIAATLFVTGGNQDASSVRVALTVDTANNKIDEDQVLGAQSCR